jgi:hypothetical protein
VSGAAALALASVASPARADLDVQIVAGPTLGWMRRLPDHLRTTAPVVLPSRVLPQATAVGTTESGLTMLGAMTDASLTIDDRITVPVLGLHVATAVGPYDTILTQADGSIARLRPWTAYRLDLLLPGVGVRHKHRRLMFAALVRPGVAFLRMGSSIAGGGERAEVALSAAAFTVQLELEACRRLDPLSRACVVFAPKLYEWHVANGATLGLRWEWGR